MDDEEEKQLKRLRVCLIMPTKGYVKNNNFKLSKDVGFLYNYDDCYFLLIFHKILFL